MTTILILATIALAAWLAFTLVRGRDASSQDGTEDFARAMQAISPPQAPDRRPGPGVLRPHPPRRRPPAQRARRRLPR